MELYRVIECDRGFFFLTYLEICKFHHEHLKTAEFLFRMQKMRLSVNFSPSRRVFFGVWELDGKKLKLKFKLR